MELCKILRGRRKKSSKAERHRHAGSSEKGGEVLYCEKDAPSMLLERTLVFSHEERELLFHIRKRNAIEQSNRLVGVTQEPRCRPTSRTRKRRRGWTKEKVNCLEVMVSGQWEWSGPRAVSSRVRAHRRFDDRNFVEKVLASVYPWNDQGAAEHRKHWNSK